MRRVRCSSCVLTFVALVAFAVVLAACGSSSNRPSVPSSITRPTTSTSGGEATTTTLPETTTTTAASSSTTIGGGALPTSTTEAPTTTTTVAPTTTTTGSPTTTTTVAPTTTTAPVTTTPEPSDTETTWALVLAGIAALGLVVFGIVTIVRHRRARAAARELWRTQGPRVIGEVTTTIGVLGGVASGATQLSVASDAVRRVTASLEELAAVRLNDEATDAAQVVAARLRSTLFDVEADNLLREQNPAAPPPTTRPTAPELVDGVARLRAQVEALDHPPASAGS